MREPTVNRWAVIKWMDRDCFVEFDHRDSTKVYWGGTFSHYYIEDPEIVKDYGYISSDDYKKLEEIELDYYFNFNVPKKATPFQSAGWISPQGDFYPCEYYQHDSVGKHLAIIHYKSFDALSELEKNGWIRVFDTGIMDIDYKNGVTQKQLDTIFDLYKASDGDYKRHMRNVLNSLWQDERRK